MILGRDILGCPWSIGCLPRMILGWDILGSPWSIGGLPRGSSVRSETMGINLKKIFFPKKNWYH